MRAIEIIAGLEEHIDACEQMLQNSELGEKYFQKPGSGRAQIIEGFNNNSLFVAMNCDEIVGFMYVMPHGAFHAFPYLHLFVVRQDVRGMGIGSQMLECLERMLGSTQLFLVCADFNQAAKCFYMRHGFQEVGVLQGLYRADITELLMRKCIGVTNEA